MSIIGCDIEVNDNVQVIQVESRNYKRYDLNQLSTGPVVKLYDEHGSFVSKKTFASGELKLAREYGENFLGSIEDSV